MQRMTPHDVVEVAKRLDSIDWSWTPDELGPVLKALGLTPFDPLRNRTVRFEHPGLPGVFGFVVQLPDESEVLRISVTIAAMNEPGDQQAETALVAVFEDYEVALKAAFGDPDDWSPDEDAEWDRGEDVLELQRRASVLALVWENKRNR